MNVVRPFAATSRERAHGADREPQLRGETLVRICNLEKTYQSKDGSSIHALANINLEIRAAEFVSVVGPSGCGKTTLLKILAGILDRTSGEVEMAGSRLRGPSREVGVVFQSPVLLPWRTVLQNVMVPVEVQRRDRTAFGARASSWPWSAFPASKTNIRGSFPAVCSNGSDSVAPWFTIHHSC
jgi:ABC-type sugar transport system ATPase subunit